MRKVLLPLLLLATLVIAKEFDTYVISPTSTNQSHSQISSGDLIETLKHNFGILSNRPSQSAIDFINKAGKQAVNLFNPVQTNFLVLIQGTFSEEEKAQIAGPSGIHTSLSFGEEEGNLFDNIFNLGNPESLVSTVKNIQGNLKQKLEFYLYSQEQRAGEYFQDFGMAVSVDDKGKLNIEDKQLEKTQKGESFAHCVNKAIGPNYKFSKKEITNADGSFKITIGDENQFEVLSFLSEMCGIYTTAFSLNNKDSSFVALEISSLPLLEQSLNSSQLSIVKEIVSNTVSKIVSHFQETQQEKLFGQIIFTEGEEEQDYFSAVSQPKQKSTPKRKLQGTLPPPPANAEQAAQAQTYTLRAWFSIFFVALIFFVCYAMFNIEISKDSLLYAKFIAEEHR